MANSVERFLGSWRVWQRNFKMSWRSAQNFLGQRELGLCATKKKAAEKKTLVTKINSKRKIVTKNFAGVLVTWSKMH